MILLDVYINLSTDFLLRIFTNKEIEEIRKVRLWDIVTNTTSISPDAVQKNMFVWMKDDPCPQPFQLNSSMLESCMPLQRHDYFEVSVKKLQKNEPKEFVFVFSFFLLFSSSDSGQRTRLHLRLRIPRFYTDTLRRCWLRPRQTSEQAKTEAEDTSRGNTEKEWRKNLRW